MSATLATHGRSDHEFRGTHRPSADTARALARWLGWTVEQVLEAADQPAPYTSADDKPTSGE